MIIPAPQWCPMTLGNMRAARSHGGTCRAYFTEGHHAQSHRARCDFCDRRIDDV